MYNHVQLCFWSKHPQMYSILLQNMGWLGRIWWDWTRNLSLIAIPGFMYLSDGLIMTFVGIYIIYNHIHLCFWSKQQQIYPNLLQNLGWLGGIWWGWTRNLSMITLLGFMYLSDELKMTFYWYSYNLQPVIIVLLVKTATNILIVAPKHGLAG